MRNFALLPVALLLWPGLSPSPAARSPDVSPFARAPEGALESGALGSVRAAPGDGFAEVRWSPGSGSTDLTVTASPGGATIQVPGTATSARFTGLTNGTTYTFTVQSGAGAVSRPSNAVTPSEEANILTDISFHAQERPLTCEEAALRMALEHQGIVQSEASILDDIGVDPRHGYVDDAGTLRWGNPYTAAVGDPDGSEAALTGYGTYYPTIAGAAKRYGAEVLQAGEGIAPATLYAAVLAGHPAVAWVAYDFAYHPASRPWVTFDGKRLFWHGPFEHAVTLVGVTPTFVILDNPGLARGEWQWVAKRDFEEAYRTFGNMAVILR